MSLLLFLLEGYEKSGAIEEKAPQRFASDVAQVIVSSVSSQRRGEEGTSGERSKDRRGISQGAGAQGQAARIRQNSHQADARHRRRIGLLFHRHRVLAHAGGESQSRGERKRRT